MKKSVLIIGPNYFNYLQASEYAFSKLGYNVVTDGYDTPIHPYTSFMKLRYKVSRDKDRLYRKSVNLYNSHIINVFNNTKPSIVFIMNGEILNSETLEYMRRDAKVVVWLYDNLEKLPGSKNHLDYVDKLCCFEQRDVDYYREQGKVAYFLPQACDTATYHPLDIEKDIDISFVGQIYYSPKRRDTINAIVDKFPDKRIVVYGMHQPWYKGIWKWINRENKNVYKNCTISANETNRLYNRSKIVLNIHQEAQKDGANPRTFEIIGSGAYQICDANPYIEMLFKDGEIGVYHNKEELFELIKGGLQNDKSECVNRARKSVLADHSFDSRIKQVLELLDLES